MQTAYGAISIASERLRTMLSKCTYWQRFAGRDWTEAEALERIYLDTTEHLDDIVDNPANRPFAVISRQSPVRWDAISRGLYAPSGMLWVEFHRDSPVIKPEDPGDSEREYENDVGRIVHTGDAQAPGLLDLSAMGNYIDILSITAEGPMRAAPDMVAIIGDAWLYYLDVQWGTRR